LTLEGSQTVAVVLTHGLSALHHLQAPAGDAVKDFRRRFER